MIIASAICCAIVIIYGRSDHVFFHMGPGIYLACGAGLGECSTQASLVRQRPHRPGFRNSFFEN